MTQQQQKTEKESSFDLVKVAAGAVAAMASAVLLSTLGAAGTITGAALGSVIVTVAGSMFSKGVDVSKQGVSAAQALAARRVAQARSQVGGAAQDMDDSPQAQQRLSAANAELDAAESELQRQRDAPGQARSGDRVAGTARGAALEADRPGAAAAVFLVAMAVITGFELVSGRAVSSMTGGSTTRSARRSPGSPTGTSPRPHRRPLPPPTESSEPVGERVGGGEPERRADARRRASRRRRRRTPPARRPRSPPRATPPPPRRPRARLPDARRCGLRPLVRGATPLPAVRGGRLRFVAEHPPRLGEVDRLIRVDRSPEAPFAAVEVEVERQAGTVVAGLSTPDGDHVWRPRAADRTAPSRSASAAAPGSCGGCGWTSASRSPSASRSARTRSRCSRGRRRRGGRCSPSAARWRPGSTCAARRPSGGSATPGVSGPAARRSARCAPACSACPGCVTRTSSSTPTGARSSATARPTSPGPAPVSARSGRRTGGLHARPRGPVPPRAGGAAVHPSRRPGARRPRGPAGARRDRWLVATSSWGDFDGRLRRARAAPRHAGRPALRRAPAGHRAPDLPTAHDAWDPGFTRVDGTVVPGLRREPVAAPLRLPPRPRVDRRPTPYPGRGLPGSVPPTACTSARARSSLGSGTSGGCSPATVTAGLPGVRPVDAAGRHTRRAVPEQHPHPRLLRRDDGSWLMVTFDGTQRAERTMGYGGHGDVVVMEDRHGPASGGLRPRKAHFMMQIQVDSSWRRPSPSPARPT